MRRYLLGGARTLLFVFLGAWGGSTAKAHTWVIGSPDHGQTFAYGSEWSRQWVGFHGRLALATEFTNEPYVDRQFPRQYDDFTFHFPGVILDADGRTFVYHAPNGTRVPIARREAGLFGISEIRLVPGARVRIVSPHGYLSVAILVESAAR